MVLKKYLLTKLKIMLLILRVGRKILIIAMGQNAYVPIVLDND